MIQRIQTLFQLLACASMALLFIPELSFASVEGDTSSMEAAAQSMMADGVFNTYDHIILLLLVCLSILLIFINIFLYKNRGLQLTLNRIGMAAGIIIMILTAIFFYLDYQMMDNGVYAISIDYGILAPIAFITLLALSARYITKDEKLVRSMDRLR